MTEYVKLLVESYELAIVKIPRWDHRESCRLMKNTVEQLVSLLKIYELSQKTSLPKLIEADYFVKEAMKGIGILVELTEKCRLFGITKDTLLLLCKTTIEYLMKEIATS